MTAPLTITGLSKSYQGKMAVSDVSLALKPDEIFGLIGLNGAGKTTLIKSVLGLIHADQGEIRLFGEDAARAQSRRHLQYLPEKFQPYPTLTGEDYLKLTLQAYRLPYRRQEALEGAASLKLDAQVLRRPMRGYSKGMGQKLGLLSVLLAGRPLLMLDEPMSGLDPEARALLREALIRYRRAAPGRVIFFSSHILSDIALLCDRIGVIHDGVMRFTGTVPAFCQLHGTNDLEQAFLTEIGQERLAA